MNNYVSFCACTVFRKVCQKKLPAKVYLILDFVNKSLYLCRLSAFALFPHSVFKSSLPQTHTYLGLFWTGFMVLRKVFFN